MSRSISNTSAAAGTAANGNGLSRSLSIKTTAKSTHIATLTPPSDIKLFVTNLRLIDLDLRPDWPGITVQTFSLKNADQKQRIGGVEWALFRLFEIWDPEETSQKLQPFFPPLEPLQSLNLRAALYRYLNELKKNGLLGRESVLRKTMLDECKGDKFFEVLAFFSTAVLKKVLAARPGSKRKTAVARVLSTAPTLSHDSQASLLPLAIAHRAALVNVLRRKEEKKRRFTEFERLLNAKTDEVNQRLKQCKATPRTRKSLIPEKETAAIKNQLKDNWIGNQKWLDTMLHGDDVQAKDAFLSARFADVWHMVEKGQKLEDAAPETGLLENLQSRVQEHQTRLQKWKSFHERMLEDEPKLSSAAPKSRTREMEFRFDDHVQLQLRLTNPPETEPLQRGPLRSEYQNIILDMESGFSRVAKAKNDRLAVPQLHRRASSLKAQSPERNRRRRSETTNRPSSPVKSIKSGTLTRIHSRDIIPFRLNRQESAVTPLGSDATLVGQPSTLMRVAPPVASPVEIEVHDESSPMEKPSDSLPTDVSSASPLAVRSPQPSSYPSEPPTLSLPTLSHEEAMAEQIIFSIGDATPSPIKKPQPRLSLADRTRMSMAHASSFSPIVESPSSPLSSPLPTILAPTLQPDHHPTLHERTMLSMAVTTTANSRASLAPAQSNPHKSSARTSLFPVNQFDTPRTRKSIHIDEEASSREVTPKEELFSDDIDYDRIFKSRPRIATSPVFSPPQNDDEFDEGVTGVDLGDVDMSDEENEAWENSPSKGKGRN
ncbi:hypothetical protein K504DRAFT_460412 [Pleomassaria siparia CBS 279.74]|uniref:HAUS augmin-like complex subunit 6 N-terminal domain-containing protein n=1 Tax=Pleomassaria siparia CBS 279.74 TaxID=1314801 RepID=A0A6G1JYM6_9PLEO|nr:hypothetical protein K504DRAFT_460412 [Pleomassaria siparia CBS 279.74]